MTYSSPSQRAADVRRLGSVAIAFVCVGALLFCRAHLEYLVIGRVSIIPPTDAVVAIWSVTLFASVQFVASWAIGRVATARGFRFRLLHAGAALLGLSAFLFLLAYRGDIFVGEQWTFPRACEAAVIFGSACIPIWGLSWFFWFLSEPKIDMAEEPTFRDRPQRVDPEEVA